jgi:O-antigen/teichoic acid export membrane protein
MDLIIKVKTILNKSLFRDASVVFGGNVTAAIILILTSTILGRNLGVSSFGEISTLISAVTFIVGLSDLGITITTIRLSGKYIRNDPERYKFITLLTFILYSLIGLVVTLLGFFLAPYLSKLWFKSDAYIYVVWISMATAGILSASSYISATLQAHQKFNQLAVWAVVPTALRSFFMICAVVWKLSITAVMFSYLIAVVISTAAGVVLFVWKFIHFDAYTYPDKGMITREFFSFSKWIAVTVIFSTIATRFDTILLASRSNSIQVGIFAAANQLAMAALMIVNVLNTTLMPRVTRLETHSDYRSYFRESYLIAGLAAFGFILVLLLSQPVVTLLFGPEFLMSVNVFRLLLIAYIINIISWPVILLIYAVDRPDIQTKINILQVITQIAGNYFLMPILGARSPAIMFLLITIFGTAFIILWVISVYSKSGRISLRSIRI